MSGRRTRASGFPDPLELTPAQLANQRVAREWRNLQTSQNPSPIVHGARPIPNDRLDQRLGQADDRSTSLEPSLDHFLRPLDLGRPQSTHPQWPLSTIPRQLPTEPSLRAGGYAASNPPSPRGHVHNALPLPERPSSAHIGYVSQHQSIIDSYQRQCKIAVLRSQQAYLESRLAKLLSSRPQSQQPKSSRYTDQPT